MARDTAAEKKLRRRVKIANSKSAMSKLPFNKDNHAMYVMPGQQPSKKECNTGTQESEDNICLQLIKIAAS